MYGYDHILVNGSLCAIAIACVEHVPAAAGRAVSVFGLQQGGAAWLNAMALALGSIAPDMDVDRSLIRQLTCTDGLHYRGLHRGWSHSIWIIIAIGAAAAPIPLSFPRWFALGYVMHVAADALSTAGVAWCYPLRAPAWHIWKDSVMRDRAPGLYHVGGRGEHIATGVLVLAAVVIVTLLEPGGIFAQ